MAKTRAEALQELFEEAHHNNIIIHCDEQAQQLLDWAAQQEGAPPEHYQAVTIGDDIFVRPEFAQDVRVLREELLHAYQQRAGLRTDRVLEAEIDARWQMIRFRHQWAISNDEVRVLIVEIRHIRKTGRY